MTKIVRDDFNSTIFKIDMGNLVELKIDDVNDVLQNSASSYDHLSIKVDCNDLNICNFLLSKGFYIVDTLVSYSFDYEKNEFPDLDYSKVIEITTVEEKDIEKISQIAYHSFYNDRFHNDSNLDNELCNLYYHNWIRNSCNGFSDIVLVSKDKDANTLGFVTGKYYDDEHSAIVLNAVTEFARGKGVFTAMIYETMKYFKGKSNILTTGTQINNYAAQKAWTRLGFKMFDSKYVLHKKNNRI